jgi:hypothetical protein
MRICRQCQCKMVEGLDVKVDSAGYGITIAAGTGIFANRIEKSNHGGSGFHRSGT